METRVDESGNEFVVVAPGAKKPKRASSAGRKSDVEIAELAIQEWARPIAFQAGQFWSYHPDMGWEVCTNQLQVLCNALRGNHTEASVMKIIAARRAIPDLELSTTQATYWELLGDQWAPFPVTSKQVLFSNGLLDLETYDFTPTEQRIVYGPRLSLPFVFGDISQCDEFEKLVEYAVPDAEQREYLQSLCSLILQPHVVFRGQIVFVGVPHSGKSTLATAIATAPGGVRGLSTANEKRLVKDKWASTMIVNKFANVSHDSDLTSAWESWMKQYTTGTFTAEPKFGKPVTCPSTAKLISTCNEFQPTQDLSGAATQRYKVFRFSNPIAESNNHDQGKYMLSSYWAEPERRQGILNWLLEGLSRVVESGLREPQSLQIVKNEAMCESNQVLEFITNCVEVSKDGFLPTEDLLAAIGGSERSTSMAISKYMERIHNATKTRQNGKRGYAGFKLS